MATPLSDYTVAGSQTRNKVFRGHPAPAMNAVSRQIGFAASQAKHASTLPSVLTLGCKSSTAALKLKKTGGCDSQHHVLRLKAQTAWSEWKCMREDVKVDKSEVPLGEGWRSM